MSPRVITQKEIKEIIDIHSKNLQPELSIDKQYTRFTFTVLFVVLPCTLSVTRKVFIEYSVHK